VAAYPEAKLTVADPTTDAGAQPDPARRQRLHRYQGPIFDSARWDHFVARPGDIVVCTAPKCGTTWTQMLCALLVHGSPQLPLPLTRLSRWLDRHTQPVEQVIAEFDAQPFRRIVKTHTPLDGLPYFEDVSYVVCGRDPRDALLSMLDHFANLSDHSLAQAARRAGMHDGFRVPKDPNEVFRTYMTTPAQPWTQDGFPFGSALHYAQTFWAFRRLPNIFFLHYADLARRLDEEMRRLAGFLAIDVDSEQWPELVAAASFASMKSRADDVAPGAHLGEWTSNAEFFRKARVGEWREILSLDNQDLYERITRERLEPPLKAWLENGRMAADPKDL
jgi:aryl sulfotransferase